MMKMILVAIAALALTSNAVAGSKGGGGGNLTGAEFADTAVRAIQNAIHANKSLSLGKTTVALSKLLVLAKTMKVTVSKVPLVLGEATVDAINYPSKKEVRIDQTRWSKLNLVDKQRLAVHEVLGLAGVDDLSYQVSRFLIQSDEACHTDGCEMVANAKFEAVRLYLDGDGCGGLLGHIVSFEKISADRFSVWCNDSEQLKAMNLKVRSKMPYESAEPSDYVVSETK